MKMRAFGRATLCAALAGLAAAPQAPPEPALAPVGPLGHWRGDTGADDASGNGFHGTCSAGAATAPEVPKTKFPNPGGFSFDGVGGMVTIPDHPALRITGDFTLSLWKRKIANVKDWSRIVGKGNGTQRNYGLWEAPEGDGRLLFQMYGPGGQAVIDLFSSAPIPINAWAHVLCTVSVNSVAMYVDGKLSANGTRNGEPGTAGDPLTFGHAGFHAFWTGQIDDVRLYNRALSMSEIVYLAAGNGPPAPPAGLAKSAAGPGEVALRWTASPTPPPAGTATYYRVKRSGTAGKDHVAIAGMLTGTTWTDLKAEPGKTYHYLVTALNTAGESIPSNELEVAVPAK
jgi:hypothetical protein